MLEIGTFAAVGGDGPPVAVLRLSGELDTATAPLLRARVSQVVEAGGHQVILDLSELTLCDVAGLQALLDLQRQCMVEQGWIRLAGAPRRIRRLLETSRLISRLPCYYDLAQALAGQPVGPQPVEPVGPQPVEPSAPPATL